MALKENIDPRNWATDEETVVELYQKAVSLIKKEEEELHQKAVSIINTHLKEKYSSVDDMKEVLEDSELINKKREEVKLLQEKEERKAAVSRILNIIW